MYLMLIVIIIILTIVVGSGILLILFIPVISRGFYDFFHDMHRNYNKWNCVLFIAQSDDNLRKQKDEFIRNADFPNSVALPSGSYQNSYRSSCAYLNRMDMLPLKIKISKDIQGQTIDLIVIYDNINKLIYPNQEYSHLTCPDCGGNLFWILSNRFSNMENGGFSIRYYALCSKCPQLVNYYDEPSYDQEIFERTKKIKESNEKFRSLSEKEFVDKLIETEMWYGGLQDPLR